ncbi:MULTISPECIES: ABC transporter permease [Bacillaceae]|uniref:Proline/glycine betaine ABC transporter permease n=1 Tax=Evansella alkalicola TaxID=745819 RepID=A0ABS6K275_9BACI|nr:MULTISPECIES: proline/glycine betaine ABC transporter permease [Bacillaceae]MBU9723777.1 proline/glycine betaine ABC transporter permease [Bacillus alkalicola]
MLNFLHDLLDFIPRIPLASWADTTIDVIKDVFSFIFNPISVYLRAFMEWMVDIIGAVPPIFIILLVALYAFYISGKKFGLAAFSIVGLWLIYNQGLWTQLVQSFTLVLIASLLSVIIGVPFGILMAKNNIAQTIMKPVLDFMQTMPAFVYLIPAAAFFGIGYVPGVFASLIFAVPPTVRLTNLGIRQVSTELVEAADAFGSTPAQKLFKVELPMAKATIMAGINQTIMLVLSMVVIASLIGAPGLGREVTRALQGANVGTGFVAGISIVILAIIVDRFSQGFDGKKKG